MTKPTKKTLEYYDWSSVEKYFIDNEIWDEELSGDVWIELCNIKGIKSGTPFTITDWELKYADGKFAYLVTDFMKDVIPDLLEHFGEPHTEYPDSGILSATFIKSW